MSSAAQDITAQNTASVAADISVLSLVQLTANNLGFEVLTIEQFADRMQVSRETVHAWKNDGTLVKGRHYSENRSIVRFPWPLSYFFIMEDQEKDSNATSRAPADKHKEPARQKPKRKSQKISTQANSTVNLEYKSK